MHSDWSPVNSSSSVLVISSPPGIKLREANQQQQFNRNVEDIELWLYEVEGQLASDDYGKDLTSVQNLQKKHALLEADVAAHQVHTRTHRDAQTCNTPTHKHRPANTHTKTMQTHTHTHIHT